MLVNSQEQFCREAIAAADSVRKADDPVVTRIFKPIESGD